MARRIVDLSYPIHEGMTTFPGHWHPVVEVTILGRHGIENRESRKLVLGTHTGTHCDAPSHFIPGGGTVDQIPLDTLVGPATVLDLSGCRELEEVIPNVLRAALGRRRLDRLILRFDWCRQWGRMEFFTRHPYLSVAAAEWLLSRGVRLLATDTPNLDNPAHGRLADPDSPVHKVLLGRGVVLVEYLCNLRSLRRSEVNLVVLPLRVQGADGAPARCIAIENQGGPRP